jgi:hypothetical protein
MLEWSMAHPWLTFIIIITALAVMDNGVVAVCNTVRILWGGR